MIYDILRNFVEYVVPRSSVFLSYISAVVLNGFNKILFDELCFQVATFVGFPTADEINGTEFWIDTTISRALQVQLHHLYC